MVCKSCGSLVEKNEKFCRECGTATGKKAVINPKLVGYSDRINDPAFAGYLESSDRYAWIFSIILSTAAVMGFFLYGQMSDEMDNPEALYIGLVIGGMFAMIALITNRSKKGGWTWEGTVCDKRVEKKQRRRNVSDQDYHMREYLLYKVVIQSDHRRKYEITAENDDTLYNYYQIGERVRHHGSLNSYEKYDKSKDAIIFCNACATLNEIIDEACHRCNCPLLK
ncbi:MAG: hypothetical protein KKE44_07700 [Proteobacteria bacterium]|nr:hypothetical protein [Pseudomonadota bacterium]MBU1582610.1 hypothetical protein [Pseudomonadota bacterium]